MPEGSQGFYRDLRGFDEFRDLTDLSLHSPLPDDWCIVLADIKGSTNAIAEGRYKDVNMMGAACITAVINAVPDCPVPYVFGGDGATLAVPAAAAPVVRRVLGATRVMSRDRFGLDLRAGIMPVGDVRTAGADVLVAKFQLSAAGSMAIFSGGGVQSVDALIKAGGENDRYQVPFPDSDAPPDLEGLSCRWEPLKSCRGTMMSMLVLATGATMAEKAATYREAMDGIVAILEEDPKSASPVRAENMILNWPSRGLRYERMLATGSPNRLRKWLWIYATSIVQYVLEKTDRSAGDYDAPAYRAELRANADFRRFDDTLRMILDCPRDRADEIEALFADLHARGRIAYGIHRSDRALMTCLVFSLAKGEHVHFVDGSDGGFAMAAVGLKARLKAATADPSR